jgi:hypothetical protein
VYDDKAAFEAHGASGALQSIAIGQMFRCSRAASARSARRSRQMKLGASLLASLFVAALALRPLVGVGR